MSKTVASPRFGPGKECCCAAQCRQESPVPHPYVAGGIERDWCIAIRSLGLGSVGRRRPGLEKLLLRYWFFVRAAAGASAAALWTLQRAWVTIGFNKVKDFFRIIYTRWLTWFSMDAVIFRAWIVNNFYCINSYVQFLSKWKDAKIRICKVVKLLSNSISCLCVVMACARLPLHSMDGEWSHWDEWLKSTDRPALILIFGLRLRYGRFIAE